MNVKAISINIGKALLINALFMLIAAVISAFNGFDSAFTPFLISFLVTFITGLFPFIFVKEKPVGSLQSGFLTIILSWILSFIFGMLPYVLWGGEFTLINAWFESVSGYTTTGSTILTDIEALPRSLLFWRSSTQFIGGLGVIVFLLMILPDSDSFKLRLTNLELSSLSREGYRYRSGSTTRIIVSVYTGLAICETLCLWAAGMDLFDSVNHAFTTVSTGGFSTRNSSIMHYGSTPVHIITIVFMILSSLHFGALFAIFAQRTLKPLNQTVTRYYITVILIFSAITAMSLKFNGGYGSWGTSILDGTFQTVSYITTTGFGQADNSSWPLIANAVLLIAAIHCGCAGSPSGGLKADRIYISIKAISGDMKKRLHPSSLFSLKISGKVVEENTVNSVFLYVVLYFIVIFISFLLLLICGVDIQEALSGTIATLGNVGPGTGAIGTMGNYAAMPVAAKFIFTIDMFLGRVEIFPVLIVLSMIGRKDR